MLLLDASRKAFTSLFEKHNETFYYCTLVSYDGYCPCIYAWSKLDNGLFRAMENVMYALKEEGIFGDKDTCRNIMLNAVISPPDPSNIQRALRLNNKEDIEEWLREMPEENPIEKIARIISDNDADVIKDIDICVNNTDKYFKEHAVDYDERGITVEDIREGEIEEDEIRWLGMIDILEKYGYVCEVDTSGFLEDFIEVVQDFNGTKSNNLTINEEWFDEDADTFEWCEVLDRNWESEGYCIADIEFDGDDLVLFPCQMVQLEELNQYAQEAGYSVKHAKDA